MKLQSRFLIIITLGLAISSTHTWCMDNKSVQPDSSNEKVSIPNIPVELVRSIFSKLPMERYLDVSKVMKLRQVCTQWSGILTNDFIMSSMSKVLLSSEDHCRAIIGKGLAARVQEFCYIKLLDGYENKKVASECLADTFWDLYGCNEFSDSKNLSLLDRIFRIIRNYQIDPHDMLTMHDYYDSDKENGFSQSLLEACIQVNYLPGRYKLFKLLLPQLDFSNHTILDAIASHYDASILLDIVSTEYVTKLDAFYLFKSLITQSSVSLIKYYENDESAIQQSGLAQLVQLCLNNGITSEQLLRIVRDEKNKEIEYYRECNFDLLERVVSCYCGTLPYFIDILPIEACIV